jgi:glycosyltransferase involved in cell wall biosynthesis
MLSKACVVGAYQRKLEEMAACPDIQFTVAVPPEWRDERGVQKLERVFTKGYELVVIPMAFNGSFHLHYYSRLGELLNRARPDLLHIDEEPYNLATFHALRLARKRGIKTLFFSWQNILRQYPFPFNFIERYVLQNIDAAIAGNEAAREVWRAKGYKGPISVIPQFGIDPDIFKPHPLTPSPVPVVLEQERGEGGATRPPERSERGKRRVGGEDFVIGYAGRLVKEKGVDLLITALAQLPTARLLIAGSGPERKRLESLARQLGLHERVTFTAITSTQMSDFYNQLDCLVVPSRTLPNWKEQFGRVLVEAMACGVPVIGSDSGEIPNVVGEAGLIFHEGDSEGLVNRLREVMSEAGLRERLAREGRERVVARFTQRRVAEETVRVYREMLKVSLPVLE